MACVASGHFFEREDRLPRSLVIDVRLLPKKVPVNLLIAVFQEDRFSTIATLRHVVRETGYHHADQTRHKCKLNANQTEGYTYRVDALRLAGISIVRI
jgi:hypothetical protein